MPSFPESPRCLSPFQGKLFSLHCLDFQATDRLTPRWHVGQPFGKASWESLVGKPRGRASRESHRPLDPSKCKRDTAATAPEESARACPHSRRGLTPLGRLQKYPKIHCSTGEKSSGSGTDSTQDLRPRHRRERNPEKPPRNLHGDWPFMRPPERVSEVQVVSREILLQLEKIQEVLPSRRDVAHIRRGVSRLINKRLELTKGPSNPSCNSRSSPKYPSPLKRKHESLAHSQRSPFPPHSSRGRILSLRYPERIPGVPVASQEEAQPQERQEEFQGLATIPRVRQMSQAIPGKPVSLHCLDSQAED